MSQQRAVKRTWAVNHWSLTACQSQGASLHSADSSWNTHMLQRFSVAALSIHSWSLTNRFCLWVLRHIRLFLSVYEVHPCRLSVERTESCLEFGPSCTWTSPWGRTHDVTWLKLWSLMKWCNNIHQKFDIWMYDHFEVEQTITGLCVSRCVMYRIQLGHGTVTTTIWIGLKSTGDIIDLMDLMDMMDHCRVGRSRSRCRCLLMIPGFTVTGCSSTGRLIQHYNTL